MADSHLHSYLKFALHQSVVHNQALRDTGDNPGSVARFEAMARESMAEQAAIEAADSIPFETYRLQYLEQDLMGGEQFRLQA